MNRILRTLLAATLLVGLCFAQAPAPETHTQFVQHIYNATALLYTQDEAGGMHMDCTATAYRKTATGYRFVSATHCVQGSTDDENAETHFFLTSDSAEKTFIPAKLVRAGNRSTGDDFSIFEVVTSQTFETIPLGDSTTLVAGSHVVNVASPLGLGKQYFEGYISAPKIDRPAIDAGEVKWHNVMLVHIGGGPGSSGSSIISEDQHAIVGFLVGGFGADIGKIIVPVSTFIAFEKQVDAGTYKRRNSMEILRGFFGGRE